MLITSRLQIWKSYVKKTLTKEYEENRLAAGNHIDNNI